ncbi:MAG: hypothetical protein OXU81_21720 [Gammaproteobacteria bacterium]|nr:hypothetical protein [Gammaproteobacteria bacterium]
MSSTRLSTATLDQRVQVRGRFHRSVHLPHDWQAPHDSNDYLATPALLGFAGQILQELRRDGGARAWTLTGPYGTGKSAFALFLTDLLANAKPGHPQARELRKIHLHRMKPLQPVLVQAERAPLLPAILNALLASGAATRSIASRARRLLKSPATMGATAADLLVQTAAGTPGGLLLIVDELGKYLEFAAQDPDEDVFLLQQIAEAAARAETPLLFMGVLHSGFGDYVAEGAGARRTEWQKVQGRFRDLPFFLPGEQFLDLIGCALETQLGRTYEQRFERIATKAGLRDTFERAGLRERVFGCLPLHPATALILWPLFRSKIAQHERSLFAFLISHEPHGFQEFLARESASAQHAPLYGLPALYDYVFSALGTATFTGHDARKWSLIGHAIERVPAAAPPLARDLVKSIGLLAMYGDSVGLRPSRDLLHTVFNESDPDSVDDATALLERKSIIVYRRHRKAFGLWEGSDIDLEAAFEAARGQHSGEPLHQRLLRAGRPRPLVARAHYIKTGTLRFFEPRMATCAADSVESALTEPSRADGLVLFLVDASLDTTTRDEQARALSRTLRTTKPVLVAAPHTAARLGEELDELECWQWVRENLPELEGDPVTRQEVMARTADARSRFERAAGRTLGLLGHVLDPGASVWFFQGEKCSPDPKHPRELQDLLSKICDGTYQEAPPLRNELLNRADLSSAAARARRNLLERMVFDSHRERLGIEGFPPEYGMYQALLVEGGFHGNSCDGAFRLHAPASQGRSPWKPVWREIERFLAGARERQRPLTELIESLTAPPFGLREGPLPVLITAVLQIKGEELALYEDGLFVPDVGIETLERLVRRPHTFALRCYRLNARERRVIEALGDLARKTMFSGSEQSKEHTAGLIEIVRQLVRLAETLPPYARSTQRLSTRTRAVRDLLRTATDPRSLLLEDLPQALNVGVDVADGPSLLARRLRESIRDLTRAFPNLLNAVEEQVREAFGMQARGREVREALRHRALPLVEYAGNPNLRIFLTEAARVPEANGRDWREGLARAALGGKPPTHWRDEDADAFASQLRVLAAECDALSELVAAAGGDAAATVASIGLLEPGTSERRAVVAVSREERAPVAELMQKLQRAARRSGLDPRSQLMALALAARDLLPASGET